MQTLEAIKTRRSIREFIDKKVNKSLIKKIIEAGLYAPSSKNTQPWHFMVLEGEEKDKVVDIVENYINKNRKIFRKGKKIKPSVVESCKLTKNAPVLILVFNKGPYTKGEKNVIKNPSYESLLAWTVEVSSVSAAIQNMLLAIHDMKLEGVWLADFNFARREICKHLKCNYDLIAGIAFGYPTYKLKPRKIAKVKL